MNLNGSFCDVLYLHKIIKNALQMLCPESGLTRDKFLGHLFCPSPPLLYCNHVFHTILYELATVAVKVKPLFCTPENVSDCDYYTFLSVHGGALCWCGDISVRIFLLCAPFGVLATYCELYCSKVGGEELWY